MKTFMWELLKQYSKDKGVWVAISTFAIVGVNKWLSLGLEDSVINSVALAIGAWLLAHVSHNKTVGKEK